MSYVSFSSLPRKKTKPTRMSNRDLGSMAVFHKNGAGLSISDIESALKKRIWLSQGWIAKQWKAIEVDSKKINRLNNLSDVIYSIPKATIFSKSRLKGTESFLVIKKKLRWNQQNGRCAQIRSLETQHLFNILVSRNVYPDDLSREVMIAIIKDRIDENKVSLEQALVFPVEEIRLTAAAAVQREVDRATTAKV